MNRDTKYEEYLKREYLNKSSKDLIKICSNDISSEHIDFTEFALGNFYIRNFESQKWMLILLREIQKLHKIDLKIKEILFKDTEVFSEGFSIYQLSNSLVLATFIAGDEADRINKVIGISVVKDDTGKICYGINTNKFQESSEGVFITGPDNIEEILISCGYDPTMNIH